MLTFAESNCTLMDSHGLEEPSDHLLRTLAAVPVSSSILDLGCGHGRHTEPLLRLGFPVHACDPCPEAVEATRNRVEGLLGDESVDQVVQVTPLDGIGYPDETFNWVVADGAETYVSDSTDLSTLLEESRRVLKPGGWLYLTLPTDPSADADAGGTFSVKTLDACRAEVNLAEAREATQIEREGHLRLRGLYRRVEPRTPR